MGLELGVGYKRLSHTNLDGRQLVLSCRCEPDQTFAIYWRDPTSLMNKVGVSKTFKRYVSRSGGDDAARCISSPSRQKAVDSMICSRTSRSPTSFS